MILILQNVNSEIISLDPCGNTQSYEQSGDLILENECLKVKMAQSPYNPVLAFEDKVHQEEFRMQLMGLEERQTISPFGITDHPFASFSLTGTAQPNKITYSNGNITIGYELRGMKLKAYATVTNFNYNYSNSELWLETKYTETAKGTLEFTKPIVDNIEQPLMTENKTAGTNFFVLQKLGRGNTIILDPIFTVDYSPAPSVNLIGGNLTSDPESNFEQEVDITIIMSDNDTNTVAETVNYELHPVTIFYDDFEDGTLSPFTAQTPDGRGTVTVSTSGALNGTYSLLSYGDSDDEDEEEVYSKLWQSTLGITNITLSYTRTSIESESADSFSVQVSTNNGSTWNTLETWTNDDPVTTKTYELNSSYSNNNLFALRFWSEINFNNDQLIVDEVKITGINNSLESKAISGKWSQTYDPLLEWFLMVNKVTDNEETITVYAYNDSNTLSEQKTTKTLLGTGIFNINVSNLVNYMTNTKGLSFTQLRMFTTAPTNFSEIYLRKETNDTTQPTISDCSSNNGTSFGCTDTTAHLDCTVTDDLGVDNVKFQINGVNQTAHQHLTNYVYELPLPDINGTTTYNWTKTHATDIVTNQNDTEVNILITKTCIFEDYINITHTGTIGTDLTIGENTATINWTTSNPSDSTINYGKEINNLNQTNYHSSLVTTHSLTLTGLENTTTYYYNITSSVNPNQTVGTFNFTTVSECTPLYSCETYDNCNVTDGLPCLNVTDLNQCGEVYNGSPSDFDTFCDYCEEDLEVTYGTCPIEEQQTVDYVDNNQTSCCEVTSLLSDCSILTYPYNTTTNQSCVFFQQNFTCNYDSEPFLQKKINVQCILPTSEEYCCVVNTFKNGELLSTSPEYNKPSENFFSLGQEEETRNCFTTTNNLLNAYYKNDHLRTETDFVLSVECSKENSTETLKSQMLITPIYEKSDWIVNVYVYIKENAIFVMAILFGLVIITGFIGYYIKRIKGR